MMHDNASSLKKKISTPNSPAKARFNPLLRRSRLLTFMPNIGISAFSSHESRATKP